MHRFKEYLTLLPEAWSFKSNVNQKYGDFNREDPGSVKGLTGVGSVGPLQHYATVPQNDVYAKHKLIDDKGELHIDLTGRAYASNKKSLYISTVSSSGKSPVKVHEYYHHLLKSGHYDTLIGSEHSKGGGDEVWRRLAKMPGIKVHGWKKHDYDEKKGEPVNIDPQNPDETHADLYGPDDSDAKDVGNMLLVASYHKRLDRSPKKPKVVSEDAPANNVGSGNIAGVGVGPNGEPGVSKKIQRKRQKINAGLADDRTADVALLRRSTPLQEDISKNDDKFAGSKVFKIPAEKFNSMRLEKRKGAHWKKYIGTDEHGIAIHAYAKKNPKHPIILANSNTGAMFYARYGKKI